MAHAAAHLSHLYAGTSPQMGTNAADALKYKAEAVRILHKWLSDPQKALSYDAFAAVIRLLTFEVIKLRTIFASGYSRVAGD